MRRSLLLCWGALVGCPSPVIGEPSYAADVAPVLEHHCVRCHTAAGRRDGGVELDSYEAARSTRVRSTCTALEPHLVEAFASSLVSAVADPGQPACDGWRVASMPPGAVDHLSLEEQQILARWVQTGAQR